MCNFELPNIFKSQDKPTLLFNLITIILKDMKKVTLFLSLLFALVGMNANAAMYIIGNNPFGNWDPANGVEMELQDDGTYKLDATFTQADVWFIFAETVGEWDDVNAVRYDPGTGSDMEVQANAEFTAVKGNSGKSFKFSGTVGEKYTFTFDPATLKGTVSGYVEPITEFTYTVAGPQSVFGTDWDPTNTDNDMTLDETDGLYKLVKNDVQISGGTTLFYKVVRNHSWGTNWGKTPNGDNQEYNFLESGTYTLTFMFDLENEVVSLDAQKSGDSPVVDPITGKFYMLGNVNGNAWAGNVGAEMATADEDIFTLTDAVIADSGDGYGYFSFASKLGENADDWAFNDYRRGAMADGTLVENGVNAELNTWGTSYAFKALPGTYDVEVSLSSDYVKLTLKGGEQPVAMRGDVNNDQAVNISDAIALINAISNSDNGSIDEDNADVNYDNAINISDAILLINYVLNNQWPVQEMVYTVAGVESVFGSNWDPTDNNNNMVKGEDGIYHLTKSGVALTGNFEFKVVGDHSWSTYEWPIGEGNNYVVNVAEEGIYTIDITFNPEAEEAARINCTLTKTGDR